jgi:glycosyltransferase involved in cell wall biosynthesis
MNNKKKLSHRILICIVSYEAQQHIESVLERLPPEIWGSPDYHILLSDDASTDNTVEVAQKRLENLGKNHTILKLVVNQGYGGNQKVCYRFAIDNHFDIAILLHGDGQYAPELVKEFVKISQNIPLDIVLGSRMMDLRLARKGGMPFYKLFGNLILTRIQNYLSGGTFSEFHTGYRAYSTRFLERVPFELNGDGFHFDTEILLQGLHADAKIHEFLIPTHYGDEICRVAGLRYSLDVIMSSFRYRLQRVGLLTSLQYPHSANHIYQDKTDDPNSTHSVAIKYMDKKKKFHGQRVLDIGCGPGHLAQKLRKLGYTVTGIDQYEPTSSDLDEFIKVDLENSACEIDISKYITVFMLDIIEHLSSPEKFLLSLRYKMTSPEIPNLIISTPNVGFILVRINLLFGRFQYADRGILDVGHKRLFTLKTFKSLLSETKYKILEVHGIGVPFQTLGKGPVFRILGTLSSFMARLYPSLFAFQFLIIAKPKPTSYQLIELSRK